LATKVVQVSDLTGEQADKTAFATLVVRHPEFREPIRLDVLPAEVEGPLPPAAKRTVELDYTAPGPAGPPTRWLVSLDDFNALAGDRDMTTILLAAFTAAHAQPGRTVAGRTSGPAAATTRTGRRKVNYASLEHARRHPPPQPDHRGRKQVVRDHLDEVNARLAAAGIRTIDPTDPQLRDRYGL
jgi:hypothetical protein